MSDSETGGIREFGRRLPTEDERRGAAALGRIVREYMDNRKKGGVLEISVHDGESESTIDFEPGLAETICNFADIIARGEGVMVVPFDEDMSLGMASGVLGSPEEFIRVLCEKGEIESFVTPGGRLRLNSESVFAHKKKREENSGKADEAIVENIDQLEAGPA